MPLPIQKYVGKTIPLPLFHALCEGLAACEIVLGANSTDLDRDRDGLRHLSEKFSAFCQSGEINSIVNEQLGFLRDDTSIPPMTSNTLLFAETETHLLSLTLFRANPRDDSKLLSTERLLLSHSSHALFAQVSHAQLELPRYALTPSSDALLPAVHLQDCVSLAPRDVLLIDATKEFLDFVGPRDYLLVRLTSKAFLPFVWVVDRDTAKLVMTALSVPSLSRIPLALKLSAHLLTDEAVARDDPHYLATIDVIKQYAAHDFHFVRWAAIQTLCYVDLDAGRPILAKSLDDPHPHVRRAARRAIDMIPPN